MSFTKGSKQFNTVSKKENPNLLYLQWTYGSTLLDVLRWNLWIGKLLFYEFAVVKMERWIPPHTECEQIELATPIDEPQAQ